MNKPIKTVKTGSPRSVLVRHYFKLSTIVLACSYLIGCEQPPTASAQPAPTIITMIVKTQSIPMTIQLPGRTSAYLIAEVRPQVSGLILSQDFKEGSQVMQSSQLYQVDPATYDAALSQAQANLARANSNKNAVQIRVNRLRTLIKSNAVSKQDLDDTEAALMQADADVTSAQASVKAAQINVTYTKVLAPITGKIGRSSVTQGALVTTAQPNALATILQLDPMKVYISYPSTLFTDIKQQIHDGKIEVPTGELSVSLLLENGKAYSHKGSVTFSDTTVDQSTGTILVQAEFPNPDAILLPGMFVNVIIEQGTQINAMAIPQKAVDRDAKGDAIVQVVDKDNKLKPTIVIASRAEGDLWILDSGLNSGDQIMLEGFHQIRGPSLGMKVNPVDVNTPPSADSNSKKDAPSQP